MVLFSCRNDRKRNQYHGQYSRVAEERFYPAIMGTTERLSLVTSLCEATTVFPVKCPITGPTNTSENQ